VIARLAYLSGAIWTLASGLLVLGLASALAGATLLQIFIVCLGILFCAVVGVGQLVVRTRSVVLAAAAAGALFSVVIVIWILVRGEGLRADEAIALAVPMIASILSAAAGRAMNA
jgi:hypothetical protein